MATTSLPASFHAWPTSCAVVFRMHDSSQTLFVLFAQQSEVKKASHYAAYTRDCE